MCRSWKHFRSHSRIPLQKTQASAKQDNNTERKKEEENSSEKVPLLPHAFADKGELHKEQGTVTELHTEFSM